MYQTMAHLLYMGCIQTLYCSEKGRKGDEKVITWMAFATDNWLPYPRHATELPGSAQAPGEEDEEAAFGHPKTGAGTQEK